jgi:acyl-CoA reductase-like NAD-dependent aldehyde dehydrogenase
VRKAKGLVAGDPFDEEAIALANATDYGLAAAVVSADFVRAQ